MSQLSRTVFGAALLAFSASPMAMAAGGGGGGISGSSAPSYDPAVEYQKGLSAFQAKQYKKATTAFKRTLKVTPKNANAQYLLGLSYARLDNYKRARKPLEKAVKYAPAMIDAHRDLSLVYLKLDMTDKAEKTLAGIKAEKTKCAGSCANAEKINLAIAKIEDAMKGGTITVSLSPEWQTASLKSGEKLYLEAVGLINEERYEEALVELDRTARAVGPHPDVLTYIGFAHRKMQQFDVAEDYYQRALAVAPDHLGALEYYGELKVERQDLEGARQHLAKIEELCSFGCHEADELRKWIDSVQPS